ncbi:MAG: DNA gyrase inhibitor YacG [Pseudomonadota bacterium]
MPITRVNCPLCRKPVEWVESNTFRPFCSERCKLIDLGEWASGNRFIPEDADYDDTTAADLDRDGDT